VNLEGRVTKDDMYKKESGTNDVALVYRRYASTKHWRFLIALWLITASFLISASAQEVRKSKPNPLVIQDQGSFAVGGTVITAPGSFDPIKQGAYNPAGNDPAGQTLHGDHAYVFYQVPANPRKLPLVFWHGHGQSAKTWETTPDGREGFQNIFLRRRFPVYLIDQPRRGRAAYGTQPATIRVGSERAMVEFKIAYNQKTKPAVREALGQILEYNHYPEREATKMWFLVLDEAPSTDDCAFVAALRAERKFPIYLGWKYGDGFRFHPQPR